MTMSNGKGVAPSDELTENYHPAAAPHSSAEHLETFMQLFWFYVLHFLLFWFSLSALTGLVFHQAAVFKQTGSDKPSPKWQRDDVLTSL